MNEPFFSIVIPTKNRSGILPDAIQSVLSQTFSDFELIISDNDDSPTATRDAVATFKDARIRYFRTSGNLPMHENWEFASKQARGKYVTVLEDKIRLVLNALEIVHKFANQGHKLISAPIASLKQDVLGVKSHVPKSRVWPSERIIRLFTSLTPSAFFLIPKGIDCFTERSLMELARRESPTGLLFSYVCPDYSFGFQILRHAQTICCLNGPLFYIPSNWTWTGQHSNGFSAYKKGHLILRAIQELPIKADDIIRDVPVKVVCFWVNMVMYDFFTKYKPYHKSITINWIGYHAFVKGIILLGWKVGGEMSAEEASYTESMKRHSWLFRGRVQVRFALNILREIFRVVRDRYFRWKYLHSFQIGSR